MRGTRGHISRRGGAPTGKAARPDGAHTWPVLRPRPPASGLLGRPASGTSAPDICGGFVCLEEAITWEGAEAGGSLAERRNCVIFGDPFNCWPQGKDLGDEKFNFKRSPMKTISKNSYLCGHSQ